MLSLRRATENFGAETVLNLCCREKVMSKKCNELWTGSSDIRQLEEPRYKQKAQSQADNKNGKRCRQKPVLTHPSFGLDNG